MAELQATIQRRGGGEVRGGGAGPTIGAGAPLPEATRAKMEGSFNTSFSDVRVHQGDQAAQAGAEAYAEGANLHFAPGRYAPGSAAGDELIGHELTHVVQQRAGRVAAPAQHKGGVNDDPALEAEADAMGARAAAGERVSVPGAEAAAGGATAIQRKITLGQAGGPTPPKVVDLAHVEGLVRDVIALNDAALIAAATTVNAAQPNAAIRDAVLVLYRNDRTFDTMPALVAATIDRLSQIQNVAAVDWSGDAADVAVAHPERGVFAQALHGLVDPAKIEELWKLTIAGVHYQKDLNAQGKKHDPNPHYVQLAQEFEALLAVKAADKPALWSGGYDVSMYAQGKGYRTLEVTEAGKMFDQLKLFKDFSTLGPLWNNISKKFVSSFAGETHVFVRTMDKGSVLFRQELGEAVHLDGIHAMKWHVMKGGDLSALTEIDGTGKPAPGYTFDGYRAAATAMSADAFRAPSGKDAIANEPATPEGVHDKMVDEQAKLPALIAQLHAFVDQHASALKVDSAANQPALERLKQRAELRLKNDPALGVDLADLFAEIKDDLAKDVAHLAKTSTV
ncbi:MAG TPA: DUF4157 domain-containing protein [Kofleriaceae bacterium]|nr:DUF4157 domain-containing protein [Kofleriaceae bacterium]